MILQTIVNGFALLGGIALVAAGVEGILDGHDAGDGATGVVLILVGGFLAIASLVCLR